MQKKLAFDSRCQCVTLPSLHKQTGTFMYEIDAQLDNNESTQIPDSGFSLESLFEKGIVTISNNRIHVRRD